MIEIILGFSLGIIFTVTAVWLVLKKAAADIERDLSKFADSIQQEVEKNIIQARVEQHDQVFYVYNIANDHFLAQGNTVSELREILSQRFHGKSILVTEGDDSVIDALRATGPQ